MADSTLVETIKLVGGIAGLATAGFTIWDRALRSRPWAEPHIAVDPRAASVGMLSVDAPAYLRIHNPGSRSIGIGAIRFRGTPPDRVAVSEDVGREVHPRRLLPVAAEETRLLELIWVDPVAGEDIERPIWISVAWRPLTALFPRPPMVLRTSIAALVRLQEGEMRRKEEERRRR